MSLLTEFLGEVSSDVSRTGYLNVVVVRFIMPAHTHTGQVGAGDQGLDVVSINTASSRLALTPVDQS